MATATVTKRARLQLTLSAEDKELIEAAALQLGQTTAEFATSTLVHSALAVLGLESRAPLSARDAAKLLNLLDEPPREPSKELKAALARYRKLIG